MTETEDKLRDYLRRTTAELRATRARLEEREAADRAPVAVVGIGARYPGIHGPDAFWRVLADEVDLVGGFPRDRGWDIAELVRTPVAGSVDDARDDREPGSSYVDRGAFLDDVAGFDSEFFGISPREAMAMDPQQRILLHTVWEAFEHARIDPTTLRGKQVGVFLGATDHDYGRDRLTLPPEMEGNAMIGRSGAISAGRISYHLGLHGPTMTIDTMCSSSLVALHVAVRALRAGECETAVVAGTTVMSTPEGFTEFSAQGAIGLSGRCRSFSDDADGTGWAEGVGVLVLQRDDVARAQGRRVLALVSGSAVNSDGASNGLTAPNGAAQRAVMRGALADAALTAADVDVVEAHGTGTVLGDPIEARSVIDVYGSGHTPERPVLLGSFKSNLGHSAAAAGVAGIIKMVLSMRHRVVPRTLHVTAPTSRVDWSAGTVALATRTQPWPSDGRRPRRGAVSAFGASGTNAHVVLTEAPETATTDSADTPDTGARVGDTAVMWALSAPTPERIAAQAAALAGRLEGCTGIGIADVAVSLVTTRTAHRHRLAVVGDAATLPELLARVAAGDLDALPGQVVGGRAVARVAPVFVFPGQGGQWPGMARALLEESPAFAAAFERCRRALLPWCAVDIADVVRGDESEAHERVDVVQPLLWAVMVALAAVWKAAGVRPAAVIGHSQGEIAAACVAGVLDIDTAARVVAMRSRAIAEMPRGGGMLAVAVDRDAADRRLREGDAAGVSLAVDNGNRSVVVSGETAVLLRLAEEWESAGVRTKLLPVDYASHSPQVDGIAAAVAEGIGSPSPRPSRVGVYSTVQRCPTDRGDGGHMHADHWVANLRDTVEFGRAVRAALADGHDTFVEISPHPVLTTAIEALAEEAGADDVAVLPSLIRDRGGLDQMWASVAAAHCVGVDIDVAAALGPTAREVDLPTHVFSPRRYWLPETSTVVNRYRPWAGAEPTRDRPGRRYGIEWVTAGPAEGTLPSSMAIIGHPTDPLVGAMTSCARSSGIRVETGAREGVEAVVVVVRDAGVRTTSGARPGVPDTLVDGFRQIRDHLAGPPVPLWLVGDDTDPATAAVFGLVRVAALESSAHIGGSVSVPGDATDGTRDPTAVASTVIGALRHRVEDQLSVGADGLRARRLVRRRSADPSARWAPSGTVVVTGATGGIGPQIARWLADAGATDLVLTSRRGPTAPGVDALVTELRDRGVGVECRAIDVADVDELTRLRDDREAAGSPVQVVFHIAGAGTLRPLAEETVDGVMETCRSKIAGAQALDAVFPDTEFVLFSSISAVWGSADHGAYAAANAYLDALASRRRGAGRATTSIVWGIWDPRAGGGMAADLAEEQLRRRGVPFMAPATALAEMADVLRAPEAVEIVADIDWSRFTDAFTAARPSPLISTIDESLVCDASSGAESDRASTIITLGAMEPPARRAAVLEMVRTGVAAAISADAVDLATDRAFRDLGVDSLTAVDIRNRLRSLTGLRLPVSMIFDHPTVEALASYVESEVAAAMSGPAAPNPQATPPGMPSEAEADVRRLLATIPVASLQEAGLWEPLMRLCGRNGKDAGGVRDAVTAPTAVPDVAIDDMEVADLIRAAHGSAQP